MRLDDRRSRLPLERADGSSTLPEDSRVVKRPRKKLRLYGGR